MRWLAVIKLPILFICLIHSSNACSQTTGVDTSASTSLRNAIKLYHHSLSPETWLYNGSEYTYNAYYPFTINQGDPFFKSKSFDTGAIYYNNMLYEKVPLLYDVFKGELLTHDPGNNYVIRLNNDNINWFTLAGNTFIKLHEEKSKDPVLHTGFYDRLYNGNIVLYRRLIKKFNENSSSFQGINKYVVETNEYIIKKDDQYYRANNKNAVLLIMNDKKKELGQFMKKNKLNFRKAREYAIMKIVAYYDTINNNTIKTFN